MMQKSGVPLLAQPETVTFFGFVGAVDGANISALALPANPTAANSPVATAIPIRIDISVLPRFDICACHARRY